jgi:hypothetical protein
VTASGSKITFAHSGTYNIAFSAQMMKTGGSAATISIWLKQNGASLPYTNTDVTVGNNNSKFVAAWNFFVDVAAGDTVEVVWHSTDTSVKIWAEPEKTDGGATIPGIPSVILTVNQVR